MRMTSCTCARNRRPAFRPMHAGRDRLRISHPTNQLNLSGDRPMKLNLKSKVPLALAAGTFALAIGGCASTERFMDRMTDRGADRTASRSTAAEDRAAARTADRSGYNDGRLAANSGTPASVDPF